MVPRLFWLTWLFASVSFFRTHAATGAGASFPFSPFGWVLVDKAKDMLDGLYADMTEEAQFRRSTIEQYRDEISGRVQATIDRFRTDQLRRQTKAERDLEGYKEKLNRLYLDNLLALGKQRQAVQDLGKRKAVRRPAKMDDSLEQFRKLYEETGPLVDPYTVAKNYWERTRDWLTSLAPGTVPVVSFPSDYVQIERRIERQIDTLTRHVHRGVQGAVETASEGVEALERTFRNAADDLRRMPEDVVSSARSVAASTQASIRNTIDKRDVRRETRDLEAKLQALSREGAQWMDSKRQQVETTIRTLQDTLQQRNTEFEEMISKRRVSMQYASMNDATLSQILKLIDPADKGWKLIKSEGGYEVHRKFLGFGPASQYACVMCHGVINSAPKAVLALFEDNSRVAEYNSFCKEIKDVEYIGDDTKVVWVGSPPIFPFKPRDFCTVVHVRKLKDGTVVILNRATKHRLAPETNEYQRAAIILAANIIQPVKGAPNKSKLTMITQVDPGGFAPPVIVNHICTLGPIGFLKNVEAAAKKKPSRWGRRKHTPSQQGLRSL